jgi:hypothetical protein
MTTLLSVDPKMNPRWDDSFHLDEETHTYYLRKVKLPGITSILESVNIIKADEYRWAKQEHLDRGTAVHRCTHYHDEGTLDWNTVKDEWIGYINAWIQFKKDWKFRPEMIEVPLYDPVYGFAGTMDREGPILENDRAIVEIKTGPIPHWAKEQTAGQEVLLNAWDRVPVKRRRFAVKLNSDGTYLPPAEYRNPRDRQVFLAAVTVVQRQNQNGG